MATIDLGAANFESTVSSNGIVFVDFWASGCGQHRMLAAHIGEGVGCAPGHRVRQGRHRVRGLGVGDAGAERRWSA